MKKRRAGRFKISYDLLESLSNEEADFLFKGMRIYRAEQCPFDRTIEYWATNDIFEPVPAQYEVPTYEAVLSNEERWGKKILRVAWIASDLSPLEKKACLTIQSFELIRGAKEQSHG